MKKKKIENIFNKQFSIRIENFPVKGKKKKKNLGENPVNSIFMENT